MGAGVFISAVVAVLVSAICVVCGLSLASRRWAEMHTQLAQEAQAEWGRRGALWGRQLDDTLAPVQRVFGLLGDKTWADLRAECVAEALAAVLKERPASADKEWQTGDAAVRSWAMDALQASGAEMQRQRQALTALQAALAGLEAGEAWRAGDVAVRAWVTEALRASGAEMQRQQQTMTGLQAVLVSLQAGGSAPGGAGASTEVYSAVLQQQQQAIGELQQALAELQAASRTPAPDMLQARLGVLEGAVNEMRSMVGLMQRRERSAIGQAVAAALEARGADVRRLAEKVASLATERALVQPEAATQLAAQLGALEAALKQYEAEWSEAKGLEQQVFERLVRRMELMVAADVRAAQAELEAYFGEMWPRPRRAQRRPLREASRVAHAG